MKRLIINADDFGFNREITDGILECHELRTVLSTTLMVNMPGAEYAAGLVSKYPGLSVGIHLNLTLGRPVTPADRVPSLVDGGGFFRSQSEMFRRAFRFQLNSREVETELAAQVERFVGFGLVPTHCDSHHHVADCPQIFPIKARVLKRFGIRRIRTQRGWYRRDRAARGWGSLAGAMMMNVKRCPTRTYYEAVHLYSWLRGFSQPSERYGFSKLITDQGKAANHCELQGFETMARNCPEGISECVVHPGLLSDDPLDQPAYRDQRKAEHSLLTDPECLRICQRHGVELTNFCRL
jgi:predicted glycoside hydrolase/deacetylase ChbG (UPF0249 family)